MQAENQPRNHPETGLLEARGAVAAAERRPFWQERRQREREALAQCACCWLPQAEADEEARRAHRARGAAGESAATNSRGRFCDIKHILRVIHARREQADGVRVPPF